MNFPGNQDAAALAGQIMGAHPGSTPTRLIPIKGTSFYLMCCPDFASLGVALCHQKRGKAFAQVDFMSSSESRSHSLGGAFLC